MTDVEAAGLSKSYDNLIAIDDVSFSVSAGHVCALAGPNGAGKSTLIGMLLGLIRPRCGSATFDGCRYVDLPRPAQTVGAVIDGAGFHPDRSARDHLRVLADAARLARGQVEDTIVEMGLDAIGNRPVRALSLGMRQRLRLACALLGRPQVLVLDEPANGLDPQGRHWLRETVLGFARDGGTVVISTHELAEAELLADEVLILSAGRTVAHGAIHDLTGRDVVEITTFQAQEFGATLGRLGHQVTIAGDLVQIASVDAEVVGRLIIEHQVVIRSMLVRSQTLEDLLLRVTAVADAPVSGFRAVAPNRSRRC